MSFAPWVGEDESLVPTLRSRLEAGVARSLATGERSALGRVLARLLADELQRPVGVVTPDARLVETLGADSLTFVEVFAELAEAFHLNLNANLVGRFLVACDVVTVADLTGVITAIVEAGGRIPEGTKVRSPC